KTLMAIPVISRAFLISSVSSMPVTLMPVNGSFPYELILGLVLSTSSVVGNKTKYLSLRSTPVARVTDPTEPTSLIMQCALPPAFIVHLSYRYYISFLKTQLEKTKTLHTDTYKCIFSNCDSTAPYKNAVFRTIFERGEKIPRKRRRIPRTSSLFFPLKEKSAVTNFGASGFDITLVFINHETW
ncbi:hypothetical protein ALC56_14682, partial [Trachymyrmex septentrionalis]